MYVSLLNLRTLLFMQTVLYWMIYKLGSRFVNCITVATLYMDDHSITFVFYKILVHTGFIKVVHNHSYLTATTTAYLLVFSLALRGDYSGLHLIFEFVPHIPMYYSIMCPCVVRLSH